jgi:hypothetical protein
LRKSWSACSTILSVRIQALSGSLRRAGGRQALAKTSRISKTDSRRGDQAIWTKASSRARVGPEAKVLSSDCHPLVASETVGD